MRFSVIGTDAAGLTIEFSLDARCADEADFFARQRGVNVVKVWLGGGSADAQARTAPASIHSPGHSAAVATGATDASESKVDLDRSGSRPALGLPSVALGAVGLLFCWIPVVGTLSTPLGAVGVLTGVVGMAVAVTSGRAGPGRFAAPVAGVGLSGLAILASTLFAGASSSQPIGAPAPSPSTGAARETSNAQRKARNLSIVVSRVSDAEPPISPSPLAAPTWPGVAPAAVPATEHSTVRLGVAEIRLVAAEIGQVPLMDQGGRRQGETIPQFLLLRLEIRNTTDSATEYLTLAGDPRTPLAGAATLTDSSGQTVRRIDFGAGLVPVGRVNRETLSPGRSVIDTITFERPAPGAEILVLELPGSCVGSGETVKLTFRAPKPR